MRLSCFLVCLLVFCGCKHFAFKFKPPGLLKAVIRGTVKGIDIHCEKTISLAKPSWDLMCRTHKNIDIKYRTKILDNNSTKLELIINKKKNEKTKIIAAPVMIVKQGKPAALEAISAKTTLSIKTLPVP